MLKDVCTTTIHNNSTYREGKCIEKKCTINLLEILGWVELKKKKDAYSGPGPIHDEKVFTFGERV